MIVLDRWVHGNDPKKWHRLRLQRLELSTRKLQVTLITLTRPLQSLRSNDRRQNFLAVDQQLNQSTSQMKQGTSQPM